MSNQDTQHRQPTIRDREPIAIVPVYGNDTIRGYVVALESHTSGYVVTEVESPDDTAWNANGWYDEMPADAVRAAAFRVLHGPLSWEMMIQAMTRKGCISR